MQKFLVDYYLSRPGLLLLYAVFSLYAPVRGVIIPQYFAELIRLVEEKNLNFDAIKRAAYWVIGLWAITLVMQTGDGMLDAYYAPLFKREYRQFLLKEIMQRHRHHYRAVATGDATVKLYESPYATFRLVQIVRDNILPISLTLGAALVFYFRTSPLMGVSFIGSLVIMVITAIGMVNLMVPAYGKTAVALDAVHEWVEDVLRNLQAVLLSDQLEPELNRHHLESQIHFEAVKEEATKEVWMTSAALFCRYFFLTVSIGLGVYLRSYGKIASIAPIVLVTTTVNGDIEAFLSTMVYWSYYLADVRKMDVYLETLPVTHTLERRGCIVPNGPVAVQFEGARVQYGERVVFEAVSLIVPAGDAVVITGTIGCGKSTLARVLTGTMPYSGGSVQLAGCEVNEMTAAQLAATVAYVPQSPRLFDRTLGENLLYGLTNVAESRVHELIATLELRDFPTDFQMRVGKDGANLSGGQRSICYLLRAVLRDTRVIILDEPTAAMDARSAETFFNVAKTLLQGRTIIVITHDRTEIDRWTTLGATHLTVQQGVVEAH